jgi:hypothetical protein
MARRKQRRPRPPSAGEELPVRRGRPLPMGCGLLMAVLALFAAPATLRLLCMELNRGAYVADELELEFFQEGRGDSDTVVEGHLVSTGERYRTTSRSDLFGMERLRALEREHRVVGARAAVWYLPPRDGWRTIDRVNPFRVLPPSEFDSGVPTAAVVALNLLLAVGSILLIRRGLGPKPSGAAAGGGGPP